MLKKLKSPFEDFGLVGGTTYVLSRLLRRISPALRLQLHDWMVQPVGEKALLPERMARAYTTRFIEDDEALVAAMPIRPEVRASRKAQGTRCLGTFKRDQLVGYIWIAYERYEEDQARCDFVLDPPDNAVFDFDVYVLPDYRGGLAFAAIWHGATRLLHERGVRYSYSRVDHFNVASASAHKHFGWRRIGRAWVLTVGRVEVLLASQSPRLFWSFKHDQRATYRLTPAVLEHEDSPE